MGVMILLSFLGVVFIIAGWVLICNNRTYKDRERLIQKCDDEAKRIISDGAPREWSRAWSRFHRVSYEEHLWARVFFRDPSKLYERG